MSFLEGGGGKIKIWITILFTKSASLTRGGREGQTVKEVDSLTFKWWQFETEPNLLISWPNYDIFFLLNLQMNVVGVHIVMNGAPGIVKLVYAIR